MTKRQTDRQLGLYIRRKRWKSMNVPDCGCCIFSRRSSLDDFHNLCVCVDLFYWTLAVTSVLDFKYSFKVSFEYFYCSGFDLCSRAANLAQCIRHNVYNYFNRFHFLRSTTHLRPMFFSTFFSPCCSLIKTMLSGITAPHLFFASLVRSLVRTFTRSFVRSFFLSFFLFSFIPSVVFFYYRTCHVFNLNAITKDKT